MSGFHHDANMSPQARRLSGIAMALLPDAEILGQPALHVAGFRLWVHGRQFPESQDYWDGNWLNISAYCEAPGAVVWAAGANLMTLDIDRWRRECDVLHDRMEGEAALRSYDPNLFVTIRPSDALGHLSLRVEITQEHLEQQHMFEFKIDQSFLPGIVSQCRAILQEYPIRQPEKWRG
jgi:hypothetical protein